MTSADEGDSTFNLTNELKSTRAELTWFFTSSDEVMGLHGSGGFDGGGGQRVFDEEASSKVHRRMWSSWHRHEVARSARVLGILGSIERDHCVDLRRVYTPFGSGRVQRRTLSILTRQQRPLLGLVIHTEAIRKAFARSFTTVVDPPQDVMIRWIDELLGNLANQDLPLNHRLRPALDEADRRETIASQAYELLRAASMRAASHQEHAELYDELEAVSRRINGGGR